MADSTLGQFAGLNSFAALAEPLYVRWKELTMESLRIQYWLARQIYAMRHDLPKTTGENVLTGKLIPMGDYKEWRGFFYELYNTDLDDYIAKAKELGLAAQIREYEMEQYGSSALAEEKPQTEEA